MEQYIHGNAFSSEYVDINSNENNKYMHEMYCKYYFDCLNHNSKILNIKDFSFHMNFIWNKISFIKNKFNNANRQSKSLAKIQYKIDKIIFLSQNPSYEIEFISPMLLEIEQEIESLV